MKKIFAIVLFLAAASAQAQSYSKIKQHVREYDRLAGQMEDIIGTVVTNETDPLSVHKTGDTMTGPLIVNGTITADGFIGDGAGLINLTETDPVWESEKAAYATGTPLYVESDTFQTVVNRGSTITNETITLARDVKSRNATSAGVFGVAFGESTTAGDWGAAFGRGTTAGARGVAFGYGTTAGGCGAAFGYSTTASNFGAAFGGNTTAGEFGDRRRERCGFRRGNNRRRSRRGFRILYNRRRLRRGFRRFYDRRRVWRGFRRKYNRRQVWRGVWR